MLNIIELFSPLELSLILSAGSSCLEFVLKLGVLLGKVFSQLFLDFLLSILVVFEDSLEVLVTSGILQLLLELCELVTLLDLEVLLEFFLLLFTLSLILSKILLEFVLDLLHDFVHLLLLLHFVVAELGLDLGKFLSELLTLLSATVETTSQKLSLALFILQHHVFHCLDLILKFTDEAFDFFT